MFFKKQSPQRAVFFLFLVFLGGFFILVQPGKAAEAGKQAAVGTKGIISSAHPLATQAGLKVLEEGGNAFDAAVTVAAVLNVVEPMNSGMGGYGTILIYAAEEKRTRFLDSSGKIPAAVNSDVFRPSYPHYIKNRTGAKAVSTPGNVNAWWALSEKYGKLPWAVLFERASELAEAGFRVSRELSMTIKRAFPVFNEYGRSIYGKNGHPLEHGDILIQKDLAFSLRKLAEMGPKVFYAGSLGEAVDKAMKKYGGFLSLTDLNADRAEWWDPIRISFQGYDVVTASPPSTAFPSLIRLGLMSRFDGRALGHNSADYLHFFIEATKHAFWCRLAYAGDPEVKPPPLEKLLSENYWSETVKKFNKNKALTFFPPGIGSGDHKHTTHFVTADRWGNIVSATQTLGNSFGCRIMVEGTGIWLNNSLSYCTFEPKGNPMDAFPGRRKLSGDCPTIIFKDGKPWAALGTPGGHTIGQTVPQMVMNLITFGMDIQEALSAPRVSFVEPDLIFVEYGIPNEVIEELKKRGHKIRRTRGLTNAHGLTIVYDDNGKPAAFKGAADPRGGGLAAGF
ncbi:MAG: gamma-glutamyltransferase [Candidatus Aminicenantes bacterium]|nr:gamma-glutamyltransferase [Candidatus Aminicenantes bacterium]